MPKKQLPTVDVRLLAHDRKAKHTFVNQRIVAAHIGQFAMELFRQELMSLEPVLGKTSLDGSQLYQRTSIHDSVQRACLGAEALFNEMHRRGWLVVSPESDEILDDGDMVPFGLHRG